MSMGGVERSSILLLLLPVRVNFPDVMKDDLFYREKQAGQVHGQVRPLDYVTSQSGQIFPSFLADQVLADNVGGRQGQ